MSFEVGTYVRVESYDQSGLVVETGLTAGNLVRIRLDSGNEVTVYEGELS